MRVPKLLTNDELKKYDVFVLLDNGELEQRYDITSTDDYNTFEYQAHHFVPRLDWYLNTKGVRSLTNQRIIIMRKICHQHLENPEFRLPRDKFIEVYHIEPEKLLFDVNRTLSYPRPQHQFSGRGQGEGIFTSHPYKSNHSDLFDYDGCFDDINKNEVLAC